VSLSQGGMCLSCPGSVDLGVLLPHIAGLSAVCVASMGGSRPLAKRIGAWPAGPASPWPRPGPSPAPLAGSSAAAGAASEQDGTAVDGEHGAGDEALSIR
jgi:hypothetical protein